MHEIELDEDQKVAVSSDSRAIVCVAGAGTGKTEVVARRVERILAESPGESFRVLALSYTVKAADELESRLQERLGDLRRRVDADTIHGFALDLLRRHGTRIGLPMEPEVLTRIEDRVELLESWLADEGYELGDSAPSEVFSRLDMARATGTPAQYLEEWRDAMASRGALDFPAMLDRASELLEGSSMRRQLRRLYEHVIVDEAQNLTLAQYKLLRRLIGEPEGEHLNAMVVGDERQSIVTFAGADPRLISRFETTYGAERVELHRNYRSAGRIIQLGHAITEALGAPVPPDEGIYAARGSVDLAQAGNEQSEGALVADWVERLLKTGLEKDAAAPGESSRVTPEDIAVLARSGSSLRQTREALATRGIENAAASTEDDWVRSTAARMVVEVSAFRGAPEHRSIQRRMETLLGIEEDDWVNPEKVLADTQHSYLLPLLRAPDPVALIEMARGVETNDPDWPADLLQLEDALELFLDRADVADRTFGNFRQHIARCQRGDSLEPGVRLLTVHKAQGREFKAVAVVACNQGQFPDFRAETEEERMSELRTFYVAVSRPSRMLLITRARSRSTRYGPKATSPSQYLALIPQSLGQS